ncbi:hypothetical protein [Burkholderia aenigmatica]|uniref:hypothetical protein n=1 Tax=Burkholderia aenigmatica TaxID=2015348 RepID=UPI00264B9C57|nr:hypothetical protein [Burkholderia aenigmatica]MDN7876707.1 hypothetical protein [Burkholderia aenigmatica]
MIRKILRSAARSGLLCISMMSLLFIASGNASAYVLKPGDLVSSFGACSWKNNNDGTSTITMTVTFKAVIYRRRGLLIYTYNKFGQTRPSSAAARSVSLDGVLSTNYYTGDGYVIYNYLKEGVKNSWVNNEAFTGTFEVVIDNKVIADWPAIGLRPGAYTLSDDIGEKSGAAYLDMSTNGSCKVLNPDKPPPAPPPSIAIDVVAPDWSLGELPHGESEKTLATTAQQLCFTYTSIGSDATSEQFIINATSANGISSNRFRLKNIDKPTQMIPYSVTLDSGSAKFSLPNGSKTSVKMNKDKRTCFVPTFNTSVGIDADVGDYSDVLTFTVVTKS